MIKTIKEWLTVWLFITMMGIALVLVAVLMPFLALHKMFVAITDWWYTG
jgi:hypothetical protein